MSTVRYTLTVYYSVELAPNQITPLALGVMHLANTSSPSLHYL